MNKIKIDKADCAFSQYIRIRDGRCARCFSLVEYNDKGLPISHTVSHYFGRANENTRFDPENADVLCMGCHKIWGSDDKESYRNFKIHQLGANGFKALDFRAHIYCRKDRKLAYIKVNAMLKNIMKLKKIDIFQSGSMR